MKLNGIWMATAAVMVLGGSAAGVAAYGASQDVDSEETAALDQASGNEEAVASTTANEGVEQYRGGGAHGGGAHGGGAHGGGHFGGGHAGGGFGHGGHGYGGRGWGGRGWGGAGRGWGWGRGYRGYCGWYCW